MTYLNEFLDHILDVEGGYVNNPNDSGGETNYGITKEVARSFGWTGEMRELPIDFAKAIYKTMYWDALRLDDVQTVYPLIAKELADTGVNMGVKRAAVFLQRSLNALNLKQSFYKDLKTDGVIGAKTLNALRAYKRRRGQEGEQVLFHMLNCLQGAFYIQLTERREKDEEFIYGWFKNRVVTA